MAGQPTAITAPMSAASLHGPSTAHGTHLGPQVFLLSRVSRGDRGPRRSKEERRTGPPDRNRCVRAGGASGRSGHGVWRTACVSGGYRSRGSSVSPRASGPAPRLFPHMWNSDIRRSAQSLSSFHRDRWGVAFEANGPVSSVDSECAYVVASASRRMPILRRHEMTGDRGSGQLNSAPLVADAGVAGRAPFPLCLAFRGQMPPRWVAAR